MITIPEKFKRATFTLICVIMQTVVLGLLTVAYSKGGIEITHPVFGLSRGVSVVFNLVMMVSTMLTVFSDAHKESVESTEEKEETRTVAPEHTVTIVICLIGALMWAIVPGLFWN